jgi:hypothetical protein
MEMLQLLLKFDKHLFRDSKSFIKGQYSSSIHRCLYRVTVDGLKLSEGTIT